MIRTTICAAMFTLLPALSFAGGCSDSHQAMSCAQGTTWDAASQTCVEQVTG